MKLSIKNYNKIRIALVIIMSIIFSQSIIFENYIIPVFTMLVGSLALLFLRRNVTEIIADERDYEIWGKSALLAIQIFSLLAAVWMFILYAFRDYNPSFEPIAVTLAMSTCLLMLIYGFIFRFYNKVSNFDKKFILSWIILFLALIIAVRIFSGEDNWVCNNWDWVKHGNPQFSKPNISCEKIEDSSWYIIEKVLDISCKIDKDCNTPGEYLIQSRCPFTSKCILNKCNVICPKF